MKPVAAFGFLLVSAARGVVLPHRDINLLAEKSETTQHEINRDYCVNTDVDRPACPSMFVTVVSKQDNRAQRRKIRKMWRSAGDGYGHVEYVFGVCSDPALPDKVLEEAKEFGDVVALDCEEGYLNGLLTRKVARIMEAYVANYSKFDFLMKVDDDAFVSTRRICDIFTWRTSVGKSNERFYAGVFAEGPREEINSKHFPDRDPSSQWYEPYENFAGEIYPTSAKGGPGYIISRAVVKEMIDENIPEQNELNNEDKAVGVWIDKLLQANRSTIDYINLPGTDGYPEHADSIVTTGRFCKYPHMIHHHLSAETIHCLHDTEASQDPNRRVDSCFQ